MLGSDLNSCQVSKVLAWLPSQDPKTWHAVATGWNWDLDTAPLAWIAAQPGCDKATAQFLYWQARLSDSAECTELAQAIAAYWLDGRYVTARFSIKDDCTIESDDLLDAPAGLGVLIDGPEEANAAIVMDEGVPRDILIRCFEECNLPLPSWLEAKPSPQDQLDQWQSMTLADGIEDPAERQAMYANQSLLDDLTRWRRYVDTEAFSRLGAQARTMKKAAEKNGDPDLMVQADQISKVAYGYLARMQRPFIIDEYPEYPRSPKPGLGSRTFGRKQT